MLAAGLPGRVVEKLPRHVRVMYIACIIDVRCVYYTCPIHVPNMYSTCTFYVLCMYSACTNYVLFMYLSCTVYVQNVYFVCIMHVPFSPARSPTIPISRVLTRMSRAVTYTSCSAPLLLPRHSGLTYGDEWWPLKLRNEVNALWHPTHTRARYGTSGASLSLKPLRLIKRQWILEGL